MDGALNVLGEELLPCCTSPVTGFYRTGLCETGAEDIGNHSVCAKMTAEFLEYSRSKGNDLITARPEYGFPGLKAGDCWCLCASRWQEAFDDGFAPLVNLRSTHENALDACDFDALKSHGLDMN